MHLPARRDELPVRRVSAEEHALLARFIEAQERCDAAAAVAIAAQHLRVAMPPYPLVFEGRDAIPGLMERAAREGDWRLLATRANRMPAAASYPRRPGDTAFRAFKLDVVRIDGGPGAEVTTFGPALFESFGLSARL